MDSMSFDFFEFSTPQGLWIPANVTPLFACSTRTAEGSGSVAITPDAVYLGENEAPIRIDISDIRSWFSSDRGPLFTLTVKCEDTHVTYLFKHFRATIVSVMTKTVGPENVRLHAA